ncbi:MAG: hypothetical protein AAF744_15475 [Pseudomonadota bacterium]
MSLHALIVFLNLIGPDIVSSEPGRFIVHAQNGDVIWVENDVNWCTMGPQIDRMARF